MLGSKVLILLCNLFASSIKEIGLVFCRITETPFHTHGRLFWMATFQKILMGREKYFVDGCKYSFFPNFYTDSPLYTVWFTFIDFFSSVSKQHEYLSNDVVMRNDSSFRLMECTVEKDFTCRVLLTACSS